MTEPAGRGGFLFAFIVHRVVRPCILNDMAATEAFLDELRRYAALISDLMARGRFEPVEPDPPGQLRIDRAMALPRLLLNPADGAALKLIDPFLEIGLREADRENCTVVDSRGHARGVYPPLLVLSVLQSFRIVYEQLPRREFSRWELALHGWCELLEDRLTEVDWPDAKTIPASFGEQAASAAWMALTLALAGKLLLREAWSNLSVAVFTRIVESQTPEGPFLRQSGGDNPETHWYHELLILHAAATCAVHAEERHLAQAVARSGLFHQENTQPDHATNQPWALFALIWNQQTHPLADQVLHAAGTLGDSALASILLADALYSCQLFLK